MKVLQYSLEEFGICGVRCASFHPTEPILACGLTDGRIVLLKGSDHSTPFSQWVFDYILPVGVHKVTITWNVSLNNLVPLTVPLITLLYVFLKIIISHFDFLTTIRQKKNVHEKYVTYE